MVHSAKKMGASMADGSDPRAVPGGSGRRLPIRQVIAICLLGVVFAVTSMALFLHGEATSHPSSLTTTPPSSAYAHNP